MKIRDLLEQRYTDVQETLIDLDKRKKESWVNSDFIEGEMHQLFEEQKFLYNILHWYNSEINPPRGAG